MLLGVVWCCNLTALWEAGLRQIADSPGEPGVPFAASHVLQLCRVTLPGAQFVEENGVPRVYSPPHFSSRVVSCF